MLIVAVVDGASPSVGPIFSAVVRDVLASCVDDYVMREWRATMMRRRGATIRHFVQELSDPSAYLLLAGKSLGALTAVCRVWNVLGALDYQKVALLTVDPNWPLFYNWKPNLNGVSLHVRERPGWCVNVYVSSSDQKQQCGAQLQGSNAENRAVTGCDHFSVVNTSTVRNAIREAVTFFYS